jgi:hypothetical protein
MNLAERAGGSAGSVCCAAPQRPAYLLTSQPLNSYTVSMLLLFRHPSLLSERFLIEEWSTRHFVDALNSAQCKEA